MNNPWEAGPPPVLRHVSEQTTDTVYGVTVAEKPDGGGRSITAEFRLEPDDEERRNGMDTYSLWLEPPSESQWGRVAGCGVADDVLWLEFSPDSMLSVGPLLQFRLDVDDDQLALLRRGLRRVLTYGRADQRPARLELGED